MPYARPIPWDLYEEHLDEAAFLCHPWGRAMAAANYTRDEVMDVRGEGRSQGQRGATA